MSVIAIVAATLSNGIGIIQGSSGTLPWRLPKEMAFFARATTYAPAGTRNAVIMGRRTWESIPSKFRPLKDRVNVVLSRDREFRLEGLRVQTSSSVGEAVTSLANSDEQIHRIFVIGGAAVYEEAIRGGKEGPVVDRILLTRVLSPSFEECNVFFPAIETDSTWRRASFEEMEKWAGFELVQGVQEERGVQWELQMWTRS